MGFGRAGDRGGSGDGFVTVADGTRRWGRFGAAGVLARHVCEEGHTWFFLARRSQWCHQGGCWAIPGGAIDHGEEPLVAALRELTEEVGVTVEHYEVAELHEDDHGGWSYWTAVIDVAHRFAVPGELHWETAEARWVRADEVPTLELLDAFRATLDRLGLLPAG